MASEEFAEEKAEQSPRLIKIKHRGKEVTTLDLDDLLSLVNEHFEVKKELFVESPKYLVVDPHSELSSKFTSLYQASRKISQGLTPKIERISNRSEELLLQYAYVPPYNRTNKRRDTLLLIFTIISVFLAGLINFQLITDAKNDLITNASIFNIPISLGALAFGFQFTVTLIIILLIKDYTQNYFRKKDDEISFNSHFIPSPPVFELGTLGSILNQKKIFKTRNTMFFSSLYGPLISWLVSLLLIFGTLQFGTVDVDAAGNYSNHSFVAKGLLEPLIFKLVLSSGSTFGLDNLDPNEPLTTQIIMNPITLAAFAGFYISTFSMLPASHLNGGFLVRARFGKLGHIFATYIVLITVVFYNAPASLLLLILHVRLGLPELLNEESPISKKSNFWMIVFVVLLVISIPLPIEWIF